MLHKNQKLAEAKLPSERVSLRWNALVEDLRFFASVALAQLIVWRTLRRRYREASARRKAFKLLRGEGAAQLQPQDVLGFDWRTNAVGNRDRVSRQSSKQGG
jgi:hypothetical protein